MTDLASLFSSTARTKVLRTLSLLSAPLSLRQVATLAEAPLFSVQRALQQLTDEKVVLRRRKTSRVLFSLDRNHPCFTLLQRIFDLEAKNRISLSSGHLDEKAKDVLDFSCSVHRLLERGRAWI